MDQETPVMGSSSLLGPEWKWEIALKISMPPVSPHRPKNRLATPLGRDTKNDIMLTDWMQSQRTNVSFCLLLLSAVSRLLSVYKNMYCHNLQFTQIVLCIFFTSSPKRVTVMLSLFLDVTKTYPMVLRRKTPIVTLTFNLLDVRCWCYIPCDKWIMKCTCKRLRSCHNVGKNH